MKPERKVREQSRKVNIQEIILEKLEGLEKAVKSLEKQISKKA